jgi:hypothetical protein
MPCLRYLLVGGLHRRRVRCRPGPADARIRKFVIAPDAHTTNGTQHTADTDGHPT